MDKVILISGCSSGLGKYLAESLEKKKYKVYAGIRNYKKRSDLIEFWKNNYSSITPIELDINYDKSCSSCINEIIKKEKHIDVLINNAASIKNGLAINSKIEDLINILNTNVIGAFRLIKKIVPHMIKNGGGKIINITSLNGTLALPNSSLYCSSKFALEALGISMRYEVSKNNIWITNLAPSVIKTNNINIKNKKIIDKSLREKNFILKKIMPMVTYKSISKKIDLIIMKKKPPARVQIGSDSFFFSFFQKVLPNNLFDFIIRYIWNKKSKNN